MLLGGKNFVKMMTKQKGIGNGEQKKISFI
jgi:hypothetical protein